MEATFFFSSVFALFRGLRFEMNGIYVFLLLATLYTVTSGQWITAKIVEGIIDGDDDYWVIKSRRNNAAS